MKEPTVSARFGSLPEANAAVRAALEAHVPAEAVSIASHQGAQRLRPRYPILVGAGLGLLAGLVGGLALELLPLLPAGEATLLERAGFGLLGGAFAGIFGGTLTGLSQWRMTPPDTAFEGPVWVVVRGEPWVQAAGPALDHADRTVRGAPPVDPVH